LSRGVRGLLYNDKADEDNEVDTGEAVDEPADGVDSESVGSIVDLYVDTHPNKTETVTRQGGNVQPWSVDRDTDGSDDTLAATSCTPPLHRCKES